eukprot:g7020.t1
MERLATIASHVAPETRHLSVGDSSAYTRQGINLDDVVIVSAVRTPMTKAQRGGLKDTTADELVGTVLKAVLQSTGLDPSTVGDVVFGTVLSASQRATELRIGAFFAGFPESVPVQTVNRQCSSGLQAIANVVASISAGFYSIGIAGGVETMSQNPMTWGGTINPRVQSMQHTQSCLTPMGITSENVASKFGVDRITQDSFAVNSHKKAAAAQSEGKFHDEIVPVYTTIQDPKTHTIKEVVVTQDDGIRVNSNLSSLSKLPPAFKKGGSTTAGNSSQVSDGASAVLLMTRREALKHRLPILGVFRGFSAVGVDPAIMGIGPAVAIPAVLEKTGLSINDIDLFEINEAFASQATYCIKKLGLDQKKVNVNGGAIALGHPLGMTGARCTATLLHEMKRRGSAVRFGVVSMCIGSGMGAAAVFEAGRETDPFTNVSQSEKVENLSKDTIV